MSEIEQKMGFDASQAITTLANLDKAMQTLNASVAAAPAAFTAFNAKAGKTVAALKQLSSNAKSAASDLQRVVNLQSKVSTIAPKQAAQAGGTSAVKPPDLSSHIAQLQQMYQISSKASTEQKRAFQSAVTAAADFAVKHGKSASDIASTNAKMSQNMTGTANKMANALASISKKSKVAPPDTSEYIKKLQSLIPLVKNATSRQKREWQSLSSKIATEAKKAGMSVNQMAAVNRQLGQSLTGSANKIANDMQKMATSVKRTSKTWTVSWETMARVVATQMIVRALSAIRQQLRAGVTDAIAFQKAVAEIATISEGGLGGLGEIGNMVSRVASEWNMTLADTAEAAYQTVSNQIAKSEEDVESFLGTAAKFAKITKTDMATAVNLLSGTLNAFGKEVGEAESVAAKFFSTIKLGRTRAEELGQSIGSIQPIAKQLGISMEELNAGVATLTIQGLKTDKVVTQLRGVMQSFLKPTKEMKASMAELGFETGEQMLAAYNLQEAMELLKGTTDGSAQAFAKLIPRVRGMTGGIGLAEDASDSFTRSLDEQTRSLEEYSDALDTIVSTDAEKVTKAFNKIKISLANTFGATVLKGLARTMEHLEGILTPTSSHINAAIKDMTAERTKELSLELETELGLIGDRRKAYAQMAAVARAAYLETTSAAQEANAVLVAGTEWALDSIQAPIDAAVAGIKAAAAAIHGAIAESRAFAESTITKSQDTLFKWDLAAEDDPLVKIEMLRKKASEASLKAQSEAALGNTKAAKSADSVARAYFDQAMSIAASNKELQKSIWGKKQADTIEQQFLAHTRNLADAANKGAEAHAKGAKSLNESALEVSKYQNHLNKLKAAIVETQKQVTKTDLSIGDRESLAKQGETQINEYTKAIKDGIERFGKSSDPVVRKLFQEIQDISRDVEIETLLNVPANMRSIFDIVHDAGKAYFEASPVPFKIFADVEGLDISSPRPVDASVESYLGTMEKNEAVTSKAVIAQDALAKAMKGVRAQVLNLRTNYPGESSKKGPLKSVIDRMEEAGKGNFTVGNLETIYDDLGKIGDRKIFEDFGDERTAVLDLTVAVGKLTKAQEEQSKVKDTFLDAEKVGDYSDAIIKADEERERLANPPSEAKVNLGLPTFGTDLTVVYEDFNTGAQQAAASAQTVTDGINAQAAAAIAAKPALDALNQGEETPSETFTMTVNGKDHEVAAFTLAEQEKRVQLDQTKAAMATAKSEIEANPVVPKADVQPFIMTINGVKHEVENTLKKVNESTRAAGVLQNQVSSVGGAAMGVTALVGGITTALEGSISAAQRLIATLSQVQSVQGPVTASQGGQIGYFASGGRGTDTIPAMLSEGEFVTNAKSSRRFFSQLQAMNAGRTPVYRESGGSTTNIGDVSISVNESSSPRQTGREVMQAFRRETRRGSGRI